MRSPLLVSFRSLLTFLPGSYATLIIFAAFLLEKAAYLSSTSTASDDDSDDDERSGVRRSAFPSFEQYLQQKSEIRKILARRTLE